MLGTMINEKPAIVLQNVYKKFKVYDDYFLDRIKEKVFFWRRDQYYEWFSALKDINLTIPRGQVVGIVGPNGSGKTTLLKLIAGISSLSSGRQFINGNVTAVLALGLGFCPRFTGRENLMIAGCLLGMSRQEVREKEDWIIKFSELEDFIDQPLQTYSSGMQARLSFSVAAARSPEILIIDEALATGDAFFVQKALGRIHEICSGGTTALFVSHNFQQIQRLCERVILLEKGGVSADGEVIHVLKEYQDAIYRHYEEQALSRSQDSQSSVIMQKKDYIGNGRVLLESIDLRNANGVSTRVAKTGQKLSLSLHYQASSYVRNSRILIYFIKTNGIIAYAFQSDRYMNALTNTVYSQPVEISPGRGAFTLRMDPFLLTSGRYYITVDFRDVDEEVASQSDFYKRVLYRKEHVLTLDVLKTNDFNNELIFEHPIEFVHEVHGGALEKNKVAIG